MRSTCYNVVRMAKMIQIRNVPEGLHRTLKARAAQAGMSLSDFLLSEVKQVAERPTLEEIVERLNKRSRVGNGTSSAEMIRRHRDAS